MTNYTNPQMALICAQESLNGYQRQHEAFAREVVEVANIFLAFLETADAEIENAQQVPNRVNETGPLRYQNGSPGLTSWEGPSEELFPCSLHNPVQHRDRKPVWCESCGFGEVRKFPHDGRFRATYWRG